MMKWYLISFFSFFTATICCQSIYDNYSYKNFRESIELQQKIVLENFNPKLLNAAIFFATNEIRARKKLPVLKYNPLLEKAATIHSEDMVKDNFFGHTNYKNKKHREPEDRAKAAGISNPKLAENIIEGFLIVYKSGEKVNPGEKGEFYHPKTHKQLPFHSYISLTDQLLKDWMDSKGHKANILSDKALELGCGTTLYYRADFNDMPAVKATQNFQWFFSATEE